MQNTWSHVSQNMSSCCGCSEHFGMTSRRWRAIRSSSWLTRKLGGNEPTPPAGRGMLPRQIGQRMWARSRLASTMRSRQLRHTVCEHGSSLGVCSCASKLHRHVPHVRKLKEKKARKVSRAAQRGRRTLDVGFKALRKNDRFCRLRFLQTATEPTRTGVLMDFRKSPHDLFTQQQRLTMSKSGEQENNIFRRRKSNTGLRFVAASELGPVFRFASALWRNTAQRNLE